MPRIFVLAILAAALSAFGACVHSDEVTCADGRICPPGNTCDDTNARCVSPEETAACSGVADGSDCEFSGVPGVCRAGACDPLLCGDGIRTGTEACDGNDLGGADCTTAGYYDPAGLACTTFCTFDTAGCSGKCGDGVINGPELCDGAPPDGTCIDEGFDAGPLGCSGACGASFADCARFGWAASPIALAAPGAITGTGPTDVWVVGNAGGALHYDGGAWTAFATGVADALVGASAIAANDVWAVGASAVVHWNGTAWSTVTNVPTATYVDVSAPTATSVFVATTTGVLAWNGTAWSPLVGYTGGALTTMRATGATDVWAADTTGTGTLWHWDGSWHDALTAHINSISAVAADDVWVLGSVGVTFETIVAHWDGAHWTQWLNDEVSLYQSITADAPNDVWLSSNDHTMYHFDGVSFVDTGSVVPTARDPVLAFANFGPGAVFGVSDDGLVYRYRGQAYVDNDSPASGVPQHLWLDAGDDIFVSDLAGHISHWDGSAWTGTTTVVSTSIVSLFGAGPTNVWAVASDGEVYTYAPATAKWTLLSTRGTSASGVWGTGSDDLWVFSGGQAEHYNGTTWTPYATPSGASVQKLSGTGPNDIWTATLSGGELWHWDGVSWSQDLTVPSTEIIAVAALAPEVVVAVDATHAYLWNGTTWTTQLLPVVTDVFAIAGTTLADVTVATPTELASYDGTSWSPVRTPPDETLGMSSSASIVDLVATPNLSAVLINPVVRPAAVRALLRTRPWTCATKETDCTNGVDDDCDGLIDKLDPDCQ